MARLASPLCLDDAFLSVDMLASIDGNALSPIFGGSRPRPFLRVCWSVPLCALVAVANVTSLTRTVMMSPTAYSRRSDVHDAMRRAGAWSLLCASSMGVAKRRNAMEMYFPYRFI